MLQLLCGKICQIIRLPWYFYIKFLPHQKKSRQVYQKVLQIKISVDIEPLIYYYFVISKMAIMPKCVYIIWLDLINIEENAIIKFQLLIFRRGVSKIFSLLITQ